MTMRRRVERVEVLVDPPGMSGILLEIRMDDGTHVGARVSDKDMKVNRYGAISNQIKKAMNMILEMPDDK